MSVFDLPRLHFAGSAMTQLPTGPRSGLLDLATNTALTPDGAAFPAGRNPEEYHALLGPAKGKMLAGNGYFALTATVTATETEAGVLCHDDLAVGRSVDMWGHHNSYLGSTSNRGRIFDLDPSSNWTTTLAVGQFGFGRDGRSHDTGYLALGGVEGVAPPRWHDSRGGAAEDWTSVHQFVVDARESLDWGDDVADSPVAAGLRTLVRDGGYSGLVVQFVLSGPPDQPAEQAPSFWPVWGTIAPWRSEVELRTYPAGRLLVPEPAGEWPAPLTVGIGAREVTLNLVGAASSWSRIAGQRLELRGARTGGLVAVADRVDPAPSAGIVCLPAVGNEAGADEALILVGVRGQERRQLLRERETNIQADDACVFLDHPRGPDDREHDLVVPLRSFWRGRPAPVGNVLVTQFPNPRALPREPAAQDPEAASQDVVIALIRDGAAAGTETWSATCTVGIDQDGRGTLVIRGARGGSSRLLLHQDPADVPCSPVRPGSARAGYDNEDRLRYWSGAGSVSVRVLPDDWHLLAPAAPRADFDVVYREILAYYEFMYSFMREEIFPLDERCKVENYAVLIWQMCDPANRTKTYYMPPTRDLSEAKALLLLRFLENQRATDVVLETVSSPRIEDRPITTREELVRALRQAVAVEVAVMLQYLYAAYSLPTYGAGEEYVRRGEWTAEQLRQVCGDGGRSAGGGMRGRLIEVAREEMIHFLLVNNILVAIGDGFRVPNIDFGTVNAELPVPVDLSLEGVSLSSVQRFVAIERPDAGTPDVRLDGRGGSVDPGQHNNVESLSRLYARIRDGLRAVPGLFVVDHGRGGGEHRLFLRDSINARHPDYQLEVDDLSSALFAVDVVTEQGEGGVLSDEDSDEPSHFDVFTELLGLLVTMRTDEQPLSGATASPSYPVVRNPSLHSDDASRTLVTDPVAREVMGLFNDAYFLALQLMVQHFGERPDSSLRRSVLMNSAIEVMNGVMRPLAELLVTLPSGLHGHTAGPSFELDEAPIPISRPDVAARMLATGFDRLAQACAKCSCVPARVAESLAFLAHQFRQQPPETARGQRS